ncbi:MAG: AbrB/MazE/SpoVT family DNA-binding domain-containing protein [Euryarchaeota archaeon]|nr:AbrB/MazE/SpoVT family DNA-binding domain-containing protein [Euryarchaeota archaeon]
MIVKGVVGTKGELLPPKRIRDRLHLKSGSTVIYRVEGSRLVIEPVPDILTAIKLPKFGKTTVDEFEKERQELAMEVSRR